MTAHVRTVWLEGIRQLAEGAGSTVRWHDSRNPPPAQDEALNGEGGAVVATKNKDGTETAHISLRCRDLIQMNRNNTVDPLVVLFEYNRVRQQLVYVDQTEWCFFVFLRLCALCLSFICFCISKATRHAQP